MLAYFKEQFYIFDVFKLLFILNHGATNKAVLMKFITFAILTGNKGIDGLINFRIRVIVMELFLYPLFGHLSCKLNGCHLRKLLLLGLSQF